jgi:pilus assembly protein Flp/PilA
MKCVENLKKMIGDESGQNIIEYAMVAALIALGSVVAMKGFVTSVGTMVNAICANFNH